jgi:hypothetical protein
MKKFYIIIVSFCFSALLNAQVSKTLSVTAGSLGTDLTTVELATVTNLTITGTIDARDFKTLRDDMPVLEQLDISGATIANYSGTEGTSTPGSNYNYPANEISIHSFYNPWVAGPDNSKTSLTSIQLPSSLISIGDQAFRGCTGLTSVNFSTPSSLTSIGAWAFYSCTGLASVNFSTLSSLTSIGEWAFYGCTGLTSVTIPSSVTTIATYAFYFCTGLTAFNFSAPSTLTSIGEGLFWGCTELTSINIPSSVTSIAAYAFYGCTGLTSVSIPISVSAIGTYGFGQCIGLSSITTYAPIPVDLGLGSGVFFGVNTSSCVLNVPYQATSLYAAADQWKDFTNTTEMNGFRLSATALTLPHVSSAALKTVTSNVTWTASSNQAWLTPSPLTGSGTTTLTLSAQANPSVATRIAVVTISATDIVPQTITVTQIGVPKTVSITPGGLASALTTQEKNTVTRLSITGTIDARDFKTMRDNMPLLTNLVISGATIVAYSGTEGTYNYGNLYDYTANEIPANAFYYPWVSPAYSKKSLKSIQLPSSLISIGDQAFRGCTGLTEVSFPSLLSTIGYGAFWGCTGLPSVIIPETLTAIGDNVFSDCTGLTAVTFAGPSSLTSIGDWAFYNCTGLTSVNIPSPVDSIGMYSFYNCTGLTSAYIPISVTSIGTNAFNSCTGLTSITAYAPIPVDLSSVQGVFSGANTFDCVLNVPYQASVLYAAADQWKDFFNITEMAGFRLSATAFTLPATASAASPTVTSNVTWTASSNQAWLTPDPITSNGTTVLTLTAEANSSIATRIAAVTISADGIVPQTITVTQVGIPKFVDNTAGGLFAALTPFEKNFITSLVLTGTIDARDFKTMRDDMPALAQLDISGATIVAYSGTWGTYSYGDNYDYPADGVPDYAFYDDVTGISKTSLRSIQLPSSLVSIGDLAFQECTGLTTIPLPSSLTTIGYGAFRSCTGLTSVTIPASLTTIGVYAFSGCFGLTSVNFSVPSSLTYLGDYSFYNCTGLTSLNLPSPLAYIGNYTFYFCDGLTSVYIPISVNSIGNYAFAYCNSLEAITTYNPIPVDLSSSGAVFDLVNTSACVLNVPDGSISLYAAADQWKDFININVIPKENTQLSYRVANPRIINVSGTDSFGFEVQVKANVSGSNYLKGNVNLNFNNSTLSSDKSDWTVTPISGYSTDLSISGANLNVDLDALSSGVEITTTYQTLLTLRGKITSNTGMAGIDFSKGNMNGKQFYKLDASPGSDLYFAPNIYDNADFMDTWVGRVYCSNFGWTQIGGVVVWENGVNSSVWDGNAFVPIANALNLRIHQPATLTIPVDGQLTVSENTDIKPEYGLLIQSNENGTGSLITGTSSGSAAIQRYMTTDAWHIVASPVSGQSISNFLSSNPNVATDNIGARGMMDFNPTINDWNNYFFNSTSGNLETGKGFSMRTNANSAVTFAGSLQSGNQTASGLAPALWNCVGNPYTSAIGINDGSSSLDNFLTANASNLDPSFGAIYIWDNTDANNGVQDIYTIISNVNSGYSIQQGQAFMVKLNTSATSVSFNPDMQIHNPGLDLKSTKGIWSSVKLQASVNSQRSSTTIAFNSAMTKGLDPTYDAGLLRGGSDLVLYSKLVEDNGIPFAIQALPDTEFGSLIIPLGVESKTGGEIVFSVENLNLPADCQVILEDKQSHTFTDLSTKDYTTTIGANSNVSDRFQLHTSTLSTGIDKEFLAGNLIAYAVRNTEIRIKGNVSSKAVATLYDVQGRVVLVKTLEEGSLNVVPTPNIKSAIYLLSVNDKEIIHRFKIPVNE